MTLAATTNALEFSVHGVPAKLVYSRLAMWLAFHFCFTKKPMVFLIEVHNFSAPFDFFHLASPMKMLPELGVFSP